MATIPDPILPSNVRAARRSRLLLCSLLLAACGGGGGGGAPIPELAIGVDLTGFWSTDATLQSTTAGCPPRSFQPRSGLEFRHDRAGASITLVADSDQIVGTMRGVAADLNGSVDGGQNNVAIALTFAQDGSSFTGTLKMTTGGTSCDYVLAVSGVRAMDVIATDPIDNEIEVPFDSHIVVEFDRQVDPATIDSRSVVVESNGSRIPGTLNIAGSLVEFVPDQMLPVGTEVSVQVSQRTASLDGRVLGRPIIRTFRTMRISEDFRYQLQSPNGAVALDTEAASVTSLSLPDAADAGQSWRFTDLGPYGIAGSFLLRSDAFVNERVLSIGDGVAAAPMATPPNFALLTADVVWSVLEADDLVRLKSTASNPPELLVRTNDLPGAIALRGSIADPLVDWRLVALERIVTPFPTVAFNPGELILAELLTTDPVGMRPAAFANLYTFDLADPTQVKLTMRSADPNIDCFLFLCSDDCRNDAQLFNWNRCVLANSDDDGGGDPEALSLRDSRIETTLPAGHYFVVATTFHANRTGNYQLRAETVVPRIAGGAQALAAPILLVPQVPSDRGTTKAK